MPSERMKGVCEWKRLNRDLLKTGRPHSSGGDNLHDSVTTLRCHRAPCGAECYDCILVQHCATQPPPTNPHTGQCSGLRGFISLPTDLERNFGKQVEREGLKQNYRLQQPQLTPPNPRVWAVETLDTSRQYEQLSEWLLFSGFFFSHFFLLAFSL